MLLKASFARESLAECARVPMIHERQTYLQEETGHYSTQVGGGGAGRVLGARACFTRSVEALAVSRLAIWTAPNASLRRRSIGAAASRGVSRGARPSTGVALAFAAAAAASLSAAPAAFSAPSSLRAAAAAPAAFASTFGHVLV